LNIDAKIRGKKLKMKFNNLSYFLNNIVYLSPYNNLTIKLSNKIESSGFIDNTKVGTNIFKPTVNYKILLENSK